MLTIVPPIPRCVRDDVAKDGLSDKPFAVAIDAVDWSAAQAEQAANLTDAAAGTTAPAGSGSTSTSTAAQQKAEQLIAAFGGRQNLLNVDACITRLRIEVADKNKVSQARLRALGAAGVIEVGNNVQAIFGTQADSLKSDINTALAEGPPAGNAADTSAPAVEAAPAPASAPARPAQAAKPKTKATTAVLSPLPGRLVPLAEVPDATFAQGLVGYGVAIDPPREVVTVVAPVSGKVMKLWPHAFVILTDEMTGVLVHLGIDTVQLEGAGFTSLVKEGDRVEIGPPVVSFDVPAVEAAGRNPIVPVVVMEKKADQITLADATAQVAALDALFTVNS